MKNLTLLFAVFTLTFSCTKTDDAGKAGFVPDPTIIAEYHKLHSNGNVYAKYIFDENGRFSQYINVGNTSTLYEYDTNDRIINVIKTNLQDNSTETFALSYDSENRIISYGDRTFTYNPDGNYFIDDSSYNTHENPYSDPEILYTSETFLKYYEDENGRIYKSEDYEIISMTNLTTNITEIYWEGPTGTSEYEWFYAVNATGKWQNGFPYDYVYDENINPLYHSQSNLSDIMTIISGGSGLFAVISQNNLIRSGESCVGDNPCGPEGNDFTYNFNDLNLPTQSTSQYYYVGSPEGDSYVNAKYYYQTDEILE